MPCTDLGILSYKQKGAVNDELDVERSGEDKWGKAGQEPGRPRTTAAFGGKRCQGLELQVSPTTQK